MASTERNPAGRQSASSRCHFTFVSGRVAFAGALAPLQVTHILHVLAACTFLQYLVRLCVCALQTWSLNTLLGLWNKQQTFDLLLYLCSLYLDEAALLHLSKGNWPCLKKLDMCNNERALRVKPSHTCLTQSGHCWSGCASPTTVSVKQAS